MSHSWPINRSDCYVFLKPRHVLAFFPIAALPLQSVASQADLNGVIAGHNARVLLHGKLNIPPPHKVTADPSRLQYIPPQWA